MSEFDGKLPAVVFVRDDARLRAHRIAAECKKFGMYVHAVLDDLIVGEIHGSDIANEVAGIPGVDYVSRATRDWESCIPDEIHEEEVEMRLAKEAAESV